MNAGQKNCVNWASCRGQDQLALRWESRWRHKTQNYSLKLNILHQCETIQNGSGSDKRLSCLCPWGQSRFDRRTVALFPSITWPRQVNAVIHLTLFSGTFSPEPLDESVLQPLNVRSDLMFDDSPCKNAAPWITTIIKTFLNFCVKSMNSCFVLICRSFQFLYCGTKTREHEMTF